MNCPPAYVFEVNKMGNKNFLVWPKVLQGFVLYHIPHNFQFI